MWYLNPKIIFIILLICVFGFGIYKIYSLKSELAELKSTYEKVSIASTLQNAEVEKLQTFSKVLENNLNIAVEQNKKINYDFNVLRDKFNKKPIPESCSGKLEYLKSNIQESNKLW